MSTPTKHVRLSPSSAHRWMACPGAPRMESQLAQQDRPDSPHVIEGTAAHDLLEKSLSTGQAPATFIGDTLSVGGGNEVKVTKSMAQAVDVCFRFVRELKSQAATIMWLEEFLPLDALDPPEKMGGTADILLWDRINRTVHVVDYKHGRGVVVEVEDNPQLYTYVLGAVIFLKKQGMLTELPTSIKATIVQPRASHVDGPIRTVDIPFEDLVAFRRKLMSAAEEACSDDPRVGPVGDHCRWCAAKPVCPEQRSNALVVAQSEFDDQIPEEEGLPPAHTLSEEQLLEVLEKSSYLEDWIKSVRQHAHSRLEQGEEVPGWKLVPKRATRRWKDKEEAEKWFRKKRVRVGDFAPRKFVSPAQAEKLVKDLPADLVESHSSGTNLVPTSNPKPAFSPVVEAANEFSINPTTQED